MKSTEVDESLSTLQQLFVPEKTNLLQDALFNT